MAAYAALLSLAQTTDMNINHSRYLFSFEAKDKIRSIHECVLFLLSFLEDYPDRSRRWEEKIRYIAHEAEDIIDHFLHQKMQLNYIPMNFASVKLEELLKDVMEELGSIAGAIMEDRPSATSSSSSSSRVASPHAATSSTSTRIAGPSCNDAVIGLNDDIMAIKDRLHGLSSKLQVIPIVGMGGIGKTTLARTVYDDPSIMRHFDIRAWLTVSQDYSMKGFRRILLDLADSMKLLKEHMSGDEINDDYEIALKVFKNLKGRRYLIVMDDVWVTEVWDNVRNVFPDDGNGSRIMLTSRISDVAAYLDSGSPLHRMRFMTDSQSWDLLKKRVFINRKCPAELVEIGKRIAQKCLGLPLVVVLVAGFLSTVKETEASWEEICRVLNPIVGQDSDEILSLSYTHLPYHLRPCFLFMGCFPEDSKIHASNLVKLWVAEGFLNHQSGSIKSMEEEAEEYLEDLVNRNLVIVNRRKSDGRIKTCGLHDMVRDLCIRKAEQENFLHFMEMHVRHQGMINVRRISFHGSDIDKIWGLNARTILCRRLEKFPSWLSLGWFRLLRVLDVATYNLEELPSQLFVLFHLRYLALSCSIAFLQEKYCSSTIPPAISNLVNLQTLVINNPAFRSHKIYWRYDEKAPHLCLPVEIWRMPQLRHLVLYDLCMLPHPPDGSNLALENLQTLLHVENLVWNGKMVQMIRNVQELRLFYTINQDYHLHHLKDLYYLQKLEVRGFGDFSWQAHTPSFPKTLRKLTLAGGKFPWENMDIIGSLPNLRVLKLIDKVYGNRHGETWKRSSYGDGGTWKTSGEQFPQLLFMLIDGSSLKRWITESSHFPRLKCLVLQSCKILQEIPKCVGEIPTLDLIVVSGCPDNLEESAKQIKEDQLSYGNETLQVLFGYHPELKLSDVC